MTKEPVSLIVAMTKDRVIGVNNTLPWQIPEDLKRFKKLTLGHSIVMGRKTFESIGRPLPGRQNIVITRNQDYLMPGVEVAHSLDEALNLADKAKEIFVIGGGEIFSQALPQANKLYVTWIHKDIKGDAYFPNFDTNLFHAEKDGGALEPVPYEYVNYIRR